jgi:hypothetical protein
MKWLARVGAELRDGQNFDLYFGVALALFVAGLDLFGVASTQLISAATLAILALLALSALSSRRQTHDLARTTRDLADTLARGSGSWTSADEFFQRRPPNVEDELGAASDIALAGVTLSRTAREYASALSARAAAGARIRLVVMDPATNASEQAAARSWADVTADIYIARLKPTIDLVNLIAKRVVGTATVELRLIPFVPTFNLISLDSATDDGRALIEIHSHKNPGGGPVLWLTARRDPYWHAFFREQFELLWDAGRPATEVDGFTGNSSG